MAIDWRYFSIQLYKWKLWKLLSSCQQFSMLFFLSMFGDTEETLEEKALC